MNIYKIIALAIIIVSFAVGAWLYPSMPERMASHWNIAGEADGTMSAFWGIFLMPIISLVMFLFLLVLPRFDPLKANVALFKNYYDGFIVAITAFFFYLYVLTLLWNLGYRFDMTRLLAPAFGLLFVFLGVLLKHAKRNWFIGIRTPWTMSSDAVWDKTHALGAKIFMAVGMLAFSGALFGTPVFVAAFVVLLCSVLFLVLFSYFAFKKEQQR
jgi:uncharacterized membrane protein